MSKSELAFLSARLCKSITLICEKSKSEIASLSGKDDVRRLQHDMHNRFYASRAAPGVFPGIQVNTNVFFSTQGKRAMILAK
jgi:hypothetical protein